uniref:alpha/beta hydrolase n=1 Tax=Nocardia cyriacigeorgica TaxID=135487 RepID=UPI0024586C37
GTGANAIAGISMAGTSVFQLAESAPGFYRAIASYSGCVSTSDPLGQAFVSAVVARWSGNPANMWGPPGGPEWTAKDPALHADRLDGTAVYVSTGTGIPGPHDTLHGPHIDGNPGTLIGQLVNGGILEAITHSCAIALRDRLTASNIPAHFDLRPVGTHSWGYWQQDLHNSWPMISAALNR